MEVKKSDVLKMVCELYECEPRMFKEQYDKVGLSTRFSEFESHVLGERG